jgi:hypothetical protein
MEDNKLNKGALFNSTDKIFKSGKVNINGDDQQFMVSQYTSKDGKTKFPLYLNVGYLNINTKKVEGSNQPDVWGNFDYNTFKFKIAGLKQEKQREDGSTNKYLSVAVQFDKEESEKNEGFNETEKKIKENLTEKDLDDEVPF